jgi:chromate transporter
VALTERAVVVRPSLRQLLRYFTWLGATGFGGPIALVGYMERDFVERRGWATHEELSDGIAFSQLAPGPLAAQLAIYLGHLSAGARGATVAGVGFVVPSLVMVVVLAELYVRFGGMHWLQGAFYGVGAAVIAIIARSAFKLARSTLRQDTLMWALFAVSAAATAWTESELAWLFVLSGLVAVFVRTPGSAAGRVMSVAVLPAGFSFPVVTSLFGYFASAGLFVFGSGLAIVPFLHGGVVIERGWLTEQQFLDAVAVALITPGPVVITVAFIGFIVAGALGAGAAAAGVFAPVYVLTVLLAPHYQRLKANARVRAFVDGVTAAATGAIAGAAFVLGRRAITDLTTLLIAAASLVVVTVVKRLPDPVVIVLAGVVGVLSFRG